MKKSEPFHVTRCIGRSFTSEEWGEWCNTHKGGTTIVFTYKDFQFNEFDVCMTPHVKIDWKGNLAGLRIETAESPNGRWDYGIHYDFHLGGCGHAAGFISDQLRGYASEKEAVFAALLKAEEYIQREIKSLKGLRDGDEHEGDTKPSTCLSAANAFLSQIKIWKNSFDPRQLELFA